MTVTQTRWRKNILIDPECIDRVRALLRAAVETGTIARARALAEDGVPFNPAVFALIAQVVVIDDVEPWPDDMAA